MREVTTDSHFASRCLLVFFENRIKKVVKNVKKTLPGEQSFLSGMAFSVRVACHSRRWLNKLSLKCHLSLRPTPSPPPQRAARRKRRRLWSFRGTLRQFSENICSEDDLRSRIFGTFVVKFLACLPLLGFSNI